MGCQIKQMREPWVLRDTWDAAAGLAATLAPGQALTGSLSVVQAWKKDAEIRESATRKRLEERVMARFSGSVNGGIEIRVPIIYEDDQSGTLGDADGRLAQLATALYARSESNDKSRKRTTSPEPEPSRNGSWEDTVRPIEI